MIRKQRTAIAQLLLTEIKLEGLPDKQLERFALEEDISRDFRSASQPQLVQQVAC